MSKVVRLISADIIGDDKLVDNRCNLGNKIDLFFCLFCYYDMAVRGEQFDANTQI